MGNILLHVCCAPDGTVPFLELASGRDNVIGFFYGNNIHPYEEFLRRKEAAVRLAEFMNVKFIINDYEPELWINATLKYASEPEGGKRCPLCFKLQLESSAEAALNLNCQFLSTTLTISPHKDPGLINSIGKEVASHYGLTWVEKIWRKNGGFQRSVNLSRKIGLYRQTYCGCIYSFRGDELSDE